MGRSGSSDLGPETGHLANLAIVAVFEWNLGAQLQKMSKLRQIQVEKVGDFSGFSDHFPKSAAERRFSFYIVVTKGFWSRY